MKKLDKVGSDHYIRAQLMGTIGYSLYLIAGFNTFDIISFDKLYIFLLPILTTIEITYLLLTQYNYVKSKYIKLQNYKNHITEHAKFLSIGQSLSHIMHQWKQPLTQFGTSILLLKTIQQFDKNKLNLILLEELPKIDNSLSFMKKSIDEFSVHCNIQSEKSNFYLYENISNTLSLLEAKIKDNNIQIDVNMDTEKIINTHEHILSNIVLVIVDNAINQFIKQNIKNRVIQIYTKQINQNLHIFFKDNAGGIKVEPIDYIFEYFVSSDGHGIGLAIVKSLVEDKLNGKIKAQNIDDGAIFEVILSCIKSA
jgi:C4-dicarboxylate-specific signal transduction histidine kinase